MGLSEKAGRQGGRRRGGIGEEARRRGVPMNEAGEEEVERRKLVELMGEKRRKGKASQRPCVPSLPPSSF